MKFVFSIVFWGTLLSFSLAFSLDSRDQTCPDGGVCLDIDSNVCCNGGPQGGCMFSTGVCCENGFFCYEGQFCSTTSPNADDSSGLDTNCCADEACNSVIGLAPFIIPYDQQPFYSGATGSATAVATTTSMGVLPTGSTSVGTATGGSSTSQSSVVSTKGTSSTKGGSTTASPSSTSSASAASPSASKTSGSGSLKDGKYVGDICLLLFLGLGGLILLL